jgi:hypothetical protein
MQLELDRVLRGIRRITLAPVIAHSVRKDVAILVEAGRGNGAADLGVTLEPVLCVLVPEVEGTITTGGAEGAVLRVEGNGVYGVNFGDVARRRILLAVAFEGEVEARPALADWYMGGRDITYLVSLSSTY